MRLGQGVDAETRSVPACREGPMTADGSRGGRALWGTGLAGPAC